MVVGDGRNGFPIQLVFKSCDSVGAFDAFHNQSSSLISEHGIGELKKAGHTVIVLEETICMVFEKAEHLKLLQIAFERNLLEKVATLGGVRSYSACSKESLVQMAERARRVWRRAGAVLVEQDTPAEHVWYVVHGTVRVIKDAGTSTERVLDIVGPCTCFGDWCVCALYGCAPPAPAPALPNSCCCKPCTRATAFPGVWSTTSCVGRPASPKPTASCC